MARMVISKEVQVYELGTGSEMEQQLIESGKIIRHANGSYELFSQESQSGSGRMANPGDYFKVDNAGLPSLLEAWNALDSMTDAVEFLLTSGRLSINYHNPSKFFEVFLYGTSLYQDCEATLIFYNVTRTPDGTVTDADFYFVAKDKFPNTSIDPDS